MDLPRQSKKELKARSLMREEIQQELIEYGLSPGTWQDSLAVIKSVLAPKDWEQFNRLHRNFVGYRTEETLKRFYGFVFTHDLHLEINRQRFRRIAGIISVLDQEVQSGLNILDIGAGSGIIAHWLIKHKTPVAYTVQDSSPGVRTFLADQGFSVLADATPENPVAGPFDLLLCIDSLGEVNADEDGMLSETSSLNETDYSLVLEERYGLVMKLKFWKPYLAKKGRLLFWEPFKHARPWKSLNFLVNQDGWKSTFKEDESGRPYLILELP
jgi:hypothetical protein